MKLIVDECVPTPLGPLFVRHDVSTTRTMGWTSIRNGELLALAAAEKFDVFVTVDQNLRFQQNLATLPLAVLVLVAKTNTLNELVPLIPRALEALASIAPKTLVEVH